MRILGVDPGLGITGYGVIEADQGHFKLLEAGIIKSSSREVLPQKLERLHKAIRDIIEEYKPTELILEKLYSHYKHQMTAIAMAHARGVIALTTGEFSRLRLVNYSAKRVRKALTGNGNASKMQVQRTVQSILNLKEFPGPADVSDALALSLAHAYIISSKS
ncbi:MAG: crossover junction endodeoxyribonuclease RuvC [Candidatus Omnitrophica bacterium]|nr:crossover junction endodeoxyribonuclease RuvC [Candidatus Omnitrophota bacterium]